METPLLLRRVLLLVITSFICAEHWTTGTEEPASQDGVTGTEEKQNSLYSSYRCVGGNQDYLDWRPPAWSEFPEGRGDLHEHFSKENQICKFQNICLINNFFSYFKHPAEAAAPKSMQITPDFYIFPGAHHKQRMRFHNVYSEPLPSSIEFLPVEDKTVFFTVTVHSHNFAHLLLDELFPVLAAEDIFNLPSNNSLLLFHHSSTPLISPYNNHSWDVNVATNYRHYAPLVLGSHAISTFELYNRLVTVSYS